MTDAKTPAPLARQQRPRSLIGPELFPEYVRLLKALGAVALPLTVVLLLVDRASEPAGEPVGTIVLDMALVLFTVGVQLAFWTTLVFAVVDRSRPAAGRGRPSVVAPTDRASSVAPAAPIGLPGTVASVACHLALIAVVVWQLGGVAVGGAQIQVLNPELAPAWQATLVGLLIVDVVRTLAVWRVGRWTPSLAAANVLVNVAGTTAILWLLLPGDLLVSDLPQQLAGILDGNTDWTVPTGLLAAAVVVLATWDSTTGVRQARRMWRTT
ncbi:hypothetical protein [Georgenia sp. MJ170]|uniref:hypothetical protein n=1 Tax=Georgenia sunbinii TaxID=3117728 RepID=UPI002F26C0F4